MLRCDHGSFIWAARARRHPGAHDHRDLEGPHPVGCYLPIIEPENQVVSPRSWYLNVRDRYPERNDMSLTELCLQPRSCPESGLDAYWQVLMLWTAESDAYDMVLHGVVEGDLQYRPYPQRGQRRGEDRKAQQGEEAAVYIHLLLGDGDVICGEERQGRGTGDGLRGVWSSF